MLPRLQADLTAPVWVAEQEEEEDTILVDDAESWRQVWERRRWLDPRRSEVRDDRKCLPCPPLPPPPPPPPLTHPAQTFLLTFPACPPPHVHQAPASPTRSAHPYPSLAHPTPLCLPPQLLCDSAPPPPTFTPHIHYLSSPPCPPMPHGCNHSPCGFLIQLNVIAIARATNVCAMRDACGGVCAVAAGGGGREPRAALSTAGQWRRRQRRWPRRRCCHRGFIF